MISVIIHWDHKKSMDANNMRYIYQLWDYVCRSYGVPIQQTFFVDCENSLGSLRPPNPVVYALEDALSIVKKEGFTPVYVHGSGKQLLPDFEHPEKACYIVGPNYDRMEVPNDQVSVRIPLYGEPADLFCQTVLPIVLYDRACK